MILARVDLEQTSADRSSRPKCAASTYRARSSDASIGSGMGPSRAPSSRADALLGRAGRMPSASLRMWFSNVPKCVGSRSMKTASPSLKLDWASARSSARASTGLSCTVERRLTNAVPPTFKWTTLSSKPFRAMGADGGSRVAGSAGGADPAGRKSAELHNLRGSQRASWTTLNDRRINGGCPDGSRRRMQRGVADDRDGWPKIPK
eukprot:scaffold10253_cov124-Isochrysis_galbana.AAC.11